MFRLPKTFSRVTAASISSYTILSPGVRPAPAGTVVLTFDDGPNPDPDVSERLLDILEKHRARATFCVIGRNVEMAPATVRRAWEAGHDIAVHTHTHRFRTLVSSSILSREIDESIRAIRTAVRDSSYRPALFRPPRGIMTPWVKACSRAAGLEIARLTFYVRDVDVDATNWRPRFEKIKQMLMTHGGGAFVLHEMRYSAGRAAPPEKRWLPAAVDELLTWATTAGFRFGTYGGKDAKGVTT